MYNVSVCKYIYIYIGVSYYHIYTRHVQKMGYVLHDQRVCQSSSININPAGFCWGCGRNLPYFSGQITIIPKPEFRGFGGGVFL